MTIPPPTAEWSMPTRHVGRRVLYYDQIPSTLTVAAYLLTGTVVFAAQPRNPVARWLLVFAGLEAAGFAIGSAYSATW